MSDPNQKDQQAHAQQSDDEQEQAHQSESDDEQGQAQQSESEQEQAPVPEPLRRQTHSKCYQCGMVREYYGVGYCCWNCNAIQITHH